MRKFVTILLSVGLLAGLVLLAQTRHAGPSPGYGWGMQYGGPMHVFGALFNEMVSLARGSLRILVELAPWIVAVVVIVAIFRLIAPGREHSPRQRASRATRPQAAPRPAATANSTRRNELLERAWRGLDRIEDRITNLESVLLERRH